MKMRRGLESWVGETCLQGLAFNRGKIEACMGPELCVPEGVVVELCCGRRIVLRS